MDTESMKREVSLGGGEKNHNSKRKQKSDKTTCRDDLWRMVRQNLMVPKGAEDCNAGTMLQARVITGNHSKAISSEESRVHC